MSIDALLARPDGRIMQFSGQVYGFGEDQMEELLACAFSCAWPHEERSLPRAGVDLELVPMSDEEWATRQGEV